MKATALFSQQHRLHRVMLCLFLLLLPSWSSAATVFITGNDGAHGQNVTTVGGHGGNGGDGLDASAVAEVAADATNIATAKGGNGGDGGTGGPGQLEPPTSPGPGGGGGNGGGATGVATSNLTGGGDVTARASAEGGRGGLGMAPSLNGQGGWADARATGITTTGSVSVSASAIGGKGGNSNVAAAATGRNSSSHQVTVSAGATGSPGRDISSGNGDNGSGATLGPVSATSTGGGSVSVAASLSGGQGGNASGPGTKGGDGASASLTNAVTGSTTGFMQIIQNVSGGSGGHNGVTGGGGAPATSLFELADTAASTLSAQINATGGSGGDGSMYGGMAGTATAQLNLTASGNIGDNSWSSVTAIGGLGGAGLQAGNGGEAIILPSSVVSTSTGKTLKLTAGQTGASGGRSNYSASNAASGRGADSVMTNVVSGSAPAGSLYLKQEAASGGGGPLGSNGTAGRAGDAVSTLEFAHGGEALLDVTVNAYGGAGGTINNSLYRHGARSGHATARGVVQDSGNVNLTVNASSGDGMDGGNADSTASAASTGNGNVVVKAYAIGGKGGGGGVPGQAAATAFGASSGGTVDVSSLGSAGSPDGADDRKLTLAGVSQTLTNAVSGRTTGMLKLGQYAIASGGLADYQPASTSGDGGNAVSTLVLPDANPDGGPVEGMAVAQVAGTSLNYSSQTPGTPGNATALCDLCNAGPVTASATIYPGYVGYNSVYTHGTGSATARAISTRPYSSAWAKAQLYFASGGTGPVPLSATAETLGGSVKSVRVVCERPSGDGTQVIADAAVGANGGGSGGVVAIALPSGGMPSSGSNVAAAMNGKRLLADVRVEGESTTASTRFVFDASGYSGPVKLGLLNAAVQSGSQINSVRFQATLGAASLIDETFTDFSAMSVWFTDHVFDLGSAAALHDQPLTFTITLGTSGTRRQGFTAHFLVGAARSAYGTWANAFGVADRGDPSLLDADSDGLSDLEEWASGTSPIAASSTSLVSTTPAAGAFDLFVQRSNASIAAGTAFQVEWSDTLLPNDWHTDGVTETVVSDNGTVRQVRATVPAATKKRLFVRQRIALP